MYHVEANCNGMDCPPYDSSKLGASLNFNPYLFRWIVNYLHQRTQAVGVDGETSATLPVVFRCTTGVGARATPLFNLH